MDDPVISDLMSVPTTRSSSEPSVLNQGSHLNPNVDWPIEHSWREEIRGWQLCNDWDGITTRGFHRNEEQIKETAGSYLELIGLGPAAVATAYLFYGPLSFRILCRVIDLHFAYTRFPETLKDNLVNMHPFCRALMRVTLHRLHVRMFKCQIQEAVDEWRAQIQRLRDCESHYQDFQHARQWNGPPEDDVQLRRLTAEREAVVGENFKSSAPASEEHDRLVERDGYERLIYKLMEQAIYFTVGGGDNEDPLPPAAPGLRREDTMPVWTNVWVLCIMTVQEYIESRHLPQAFTGDRIQVIQAEIMWRFICLQSRTWDRMAPFFLNILEYSAAMELDNEWF